MADVRSAAWTSQRLLKASQIAELPQMIRPVDLPRLVAFFEERARELARS